MLEPHKKCPPDGDYLYSKLDAEPVSNDASSVSVVMMIIDVTRHWYELGEGGPECSAYEADKRTTKQAPVAASVCEPTDEAGTSFKVTDKQVQSLAPFSVSPRGRVIFRTQVDEAGTMTWAGIGFFSTAKTEIECPPDRVGTLAADGSAICYSSLSRAELLECSPSFTKSVEGP